tara:strand:- start:416 stop:736 length:321 start_codon:yes stop_codon:yes gene_type:complete
MSNFSLDQGDLVTTPGPSGSSGGYFIKRCKNCSDQIYSHFFGNSKVAVLKTTTLDEANRFPPQAHIYVKNKLSWIELGDRIPQFGEFYDFEKIYSPASLSRRKKLG